MRYILSQRLSFFLSPFLLLNHEGHYALSIDIFTKNHSPFLLIQFRSSCKGIEQGVAPDECDFPSTDILDFKFPHGTIFLSDNWCRLVRVRGLCPSNLIRHPDFKGGIKLGSKGSLQVVPKFAGFAVGVKAVEVVVAVLDTVPFANDVHDIRSSLLIVYMILQNQKEVKTFFQSKIKNTARDVEYLTCIKIFFLA